MVINRIEDYSPEVVRKALDELLKEREYHVASPSKKYEMLLKKCRFINKKDKKIAKSKEEAVKEH
jgi:hypothetical protein